MRVLALLGVGAIGLCLLHVASDRASESPDVASGVAASGAAASAPAGQVPTPAEDAALKRIRALIDDRELSEAAQLAKATIAGLDDMHGPESVPAARVMQLLAETLRRQHGDGWFEEARALATRALEIQKKAPSPSARDIAACLKEIGAIYHTNDDRENAGSHYQEAIDILDPVAPDDDADLATLIMNLGVLQLDQGELEKAGMLLERALAMREKKFGYVAAPVAKVLDNLVNLELDRANYEQALIYAERNLNICEHLFPEGHPNLAAPIENKARALYVMGDLGSAKSLYERAIAIREEDEGSAEYLANDHNGLGTVMNGLGLFAEARRHYEEALRLHRALDDDAGVARVLNNITDFEVRAGKYDKAAELFAESLELTEGEYGPRDPNVAAILQGYGRLELDRGRMDSAGKHLERALGIEREVFGPDHPDTALALLNHARLLSARGDRPGALAEALQAEDIGRSASEAAFGAVSERAALRFAETRVRGLDLAQSIGQRGTESGSVSRIWSAVIQSRGLVLEEMSARARLAAIPATPAIETSRQRLQKARAEYARLLVQGVDSARGEEPSRYRVRLDAARQEREKAEQDFALRSASFARARTASKVGLDEIRAALPPASALVAFSRFRSEDLSGKEASATGQESAYVAYVLTGPGDRPALVDLGPARAIDSLVRAWIEEAAAGPGARGRTAVEAENAYRATGEKLRQAVWAKVAPRIGSARRVFIVADGAFHLINFAALPMGDTQYLVETGPLIHYLATERQMLAPPEGAGAASPGRSGLLAFGGIDFDATVGTAPDPPLPSAVRLPCSGFQQVRFSPLSASADETRAIGAIWKQAGLGEPEVMRGTTASESLLKQRAGAHRVLHLATHGFFLGGGCVSIDESSRGVGTITAAQGSGAEPQAGENPLLLSGLALAGANNRLRARPGEEDGILLSEEIVGLDLSGVEWAVLSACDTGVGEIAASEGVLGLRRAFQQAGVRTVITSLWSVREKPTRQWMEALYRARLADRMGTAEAVRQASLTLLRERRGRQASTHPFYWAGFIAMGDWR